MSKLLRVVGGATILAIIAAGVLMVMHKVPDAPPRQSSSVGVKVQTSSAPTNTASGQDPAGGTISSRIADDERPADGNVTEEWASKIDDPVRRRMAFAELGHVLAADDLQGALKKASMLASSDDRRALLQGIFGQVGAKDPKTAIEAARTLNGADQTFALKTLALEWAFNSANSQDNSMTPTASMGVALTLASSDPEAAAAWASTQVSGREKGMAVAAVAREWAKTDPVAAATYAAQISSEQGGGGRWAIPGVVEQWAGTDPAGAAAWVATFPDGRERNMGINQVSAAWAAKDMAQAITWANGLTDPKSQRTAYSSIARTWASTNPQQAVSWASQISDPVAQSSAVSSAISSWAAQNPRAAAAATVSISSDSTKQAAINRVASEWARQDSAAAQAWVQSSVPVNMQAQANKAITDATRRGGTPR